MDFRLWLVTIFALIGWTQILVAGGLALYAWIYPMVLTEQVHYPCPYWARNCSELSADGRDGGYVPYMLRHPECQYDPWSCLADVDRELEVDPDAVSFWGNRNRTPWLWSHNDSDWWRTVTRYEDFSLTDVLEMTEHDYRRAFPYPFVYTFDRRIDISYPSSNTIPYMLVLHVALAGCALLALRYVLTRTLILRLSRLFEILDKDFNRFVQSCWEMGYYLVMWTVLTLYFTQQDYFWNVFYLMEGNFPAHFIPAPVYWIWVVHMGWYVSGLFALVVLDPWKSDFVAMLIHHVVTICLLMFALEKCYWRWGMWVLFSHDICDIYLHFLKLLRFMDNSRPFVNEVPLWFHGVVFGTLPVSWFVFRLGVFPARVIYIAAVWTYRYFPWEICQYYMLFNGLLIVLLGLQMYWGFVIFKIVWLRIVGGQEIDDIRDMSMHGHDRTVAGGQQPSPLAKKSTRSPQSPRQPRAATPPRESVEEPSSASSPRRSSRPRTRKPARFQDS